MRIFRILLRAAVFSCLLFPVLASKAAMAQDSVENLGTLFTDTGQREKLEAVRRGTYLEEAEKNSRVSNVRVDGIMIRNDGQNVVWVNGVSTLKSSSIEGIKVNADAADKDSQKVPVNIDGKRVYVKPGQIWSEGTGRVTDNY
ncbi:MAG: hypothetical protein PVG45_08850 [Gammaproteobacteria bacterium]|jgi:hypothetical protein